MAGRPPTVGHVLRSFLAASRSARDIVSAVSEVAAINPNTTGPRLHPEQARRVVELAFLGLVSAWEEFLEQSFVRYLAGAKSGSDYAAPLRLGSASCIKHAYQLISGDPEYDPARNYSRFGEPKWVIAISRNYMAQGSPYATKLHPSLEILNAAVRLRNRVAHNSSKSRADFKRTALVHLGYAVDAKLSQGYGVGDLLTSPANRLFGQRVRDRGLNYFQAYNAKFRHLAKEICPES